MFHFFLFPNIQSKSASSYSWGVANSANPNRAEIGIVVARKKSEENQKREDKNFMKENTKKNWNYSKENKNFQ